MISATSAPAANHIVVSPCVSASMITITINRMSHNTVILKVIFFTPRLFDCDIKIAVRTICEQLKYNIEESRL